MPPPMMTTSALRMSVAQEDGGILLQTDCEVSRCLTRAFVGNGWQTLWRGLDREYGCNHLPSCASGSESHPLLRTGGYPLSRQFGDFLPNPATILFHHRLPGFARERFLELGHIHHHTIDPILARRMRIGQRSHAQVFGTTVLAGPLRQPYEEALIGRESLDIV